MIKKRIHALMVFFVFILFCISIINAQSEETVTIFVRLCVEPRIIHTPYTFISMSGNLIIVDAKIKISSAGYTNLSLYYRKYGETSFNETSFVAKNRDNGYFSGEAIIPKEQACSPGVEYYIKAESLGFTNKYYWASDTAPYQLAITKKATAVISKAGGDVIFTDGNPYDGETKIKIPKNALSKPTTITIEQKEFNVNLSKPRCSLNIIPACFYQISPSGLVFNKSVSLELLFLDHNKDRKEDTYLYCVNSLRMFWHDGFDWRVLGGYISYKDNTYTSKIMRCSSYALFPAKHLTYHDYRPKEKILTPNNDNHNDFAFFNGLDGNFNIDIFNMRGKKIRRIRYFPAWDGKDDQGKFVKNGIYIYQFKINGRVISGTIAIVK